MRALLWTVLVVSLAEARVAAQEPTVVLDLPDDHGWTGERLGFYIEIRADGSFVGAPSFDIPRLPKTVILKLGSPSLGSLVEGNTEYFTQRHEFAVFSQLEGALDLPAITVRFSSRAGYSGPETDHILETPPAAFNIRRPPGSEGLGILVTTPSLAIKETWEPEPASLQVGSVLTRTIHQSAENVTGISLAPPDLTAPDGIRVYHTEPEVDDRVDRGSLTSRRKDVITYLVQEAGEFSLPELTYHWWNPDVGKLERKSLPAVAFRVKAPPAPPEPPSAMRFVWPAIAMAILGILILFRHQLGNFLHRVHEHLDPPHRRTRRRFLKACRRSDALEASRLLPKVLESPSDLATRPEPLTTAISDLQRSIYGPIPRPEGWNGAGLASAYRSTFCPGREDEECTSLPELNI